MRALLLVLLALFSLPALATYTKIANSGSELPNSASLGRAPGDWACTRDNASGLIWEVKTRDGGSRSMNSTYSNYDSSYGTPSQIASSGNSIGFAEAVNASSLCGYGEWRMPSQDELFGLVNFALSPSINPLFFPNTPSSGFWSGSPYAYGASFAWYVDFSSAATHYYDRSRGYGVRLVRGGQSLATYTLAASATGAGTGSINTGGIDCLRLAGATSGTCSAERGSGSSVTLSATPVPGSVFTAWSGACSGASATCTLSMDAAKAVSAQFEFGPLVNAACGTANGQTLNLAPSAQLCSTGAASGVNASTAQAWAWTCRGFNGGSTATCSASSSLTLFPITVSKIGAGSVSSTPVGIACASDCSDGYPSGSSVTLSATPDNGNHWAGWSGGACSGMDLTCTLTLNSAKAVTATFTTYSKVANNGADLPDSASLGSAPGDWACTRENSTGLLWEVKTNDGGLRDQNKTYTNYDNDTTTSNSLGFVTAVNGSALCGVNQWRMPGVEELSGLVDRLVRPTINPTYFPNTPGSNFWSGSPNANGSNYAWYVNFGYGDVYGYYRNGDFQVRLVRGGQSLGTFLLSLNSTGSGTLSADAGNLNCTSTAGTASGTCTDNLPSGVLVTLTATPAPGSSFAAWGGACSGASPTCALKIDAAQNVTARFNGSSAPVPPGAPTHIVVTPGSGSAQISFAAPANDGGAPITGYTATCTASGQTARRASGSGSPLTVRHLVGGVIYQCALTASNEAGSSPASASTPVTPMPGKSNLTPILLLLLD